MTDPKGIDIFSAVFQQELVAIANDQAKEGAAPQMTIGDLFLSEFNAEYDRLENGGK